ncbi:MAG: hypothetical protein HN341_07305 [Verrucomicrobia bacterium]|mgnify:CR=1 FL=1|nr:hypothetical protein [Verrucomicrobiota bacterium]
MKKNKVLNITSLFVLIVLLPVFGNTQDSISAESRKSQRKEIKTYLDSVHVKGPLSKQEISGFLELANNFRFETDIPESNMGKQLSWKIGPILGPLVGLLEVTGDRDLLSYLAKMSDYMMSELNDTENGEIDALTEVRAPVWYWKLNKPREGEDLNTARARRVGNKADPSIKEKVYWADPLSNGVGYAFTGRLAVYIMKHPELHSLPVPDAENYNKNHGSTYLEKATSWLLLGKKTYSYFLKTVWFDEERLLWALKQDPAIDKYSTDHQGFVLPYNRYFIHDLGFEYIIEGLNILDSDKYKDWNKRGEAVIRAGVDFWKKNLIVKNDERGPYYLWYYGEKASTTRGKKYEDMGHGGIDFTALAAFKKSGKYGLTEKDIGAIENTLLHYCYNHKENKAFRFMAEPKLTCAKVGQTIAFMRMAPVSKKIYDCYAPLSLEDLKLHPNHMHRRGVPHLALILTAKAEWYGVEE